MDTFFHIEIYSHNIEAINPLVVSLFEMLIKLKVSKLAYGIADKVFVGCKKVAWSNQIKFSCLVKSTFSIVVRGEKLVHHKGKVQRDNFLDYLHVHRNRPLYINAKGGFMRVWIHINDTLKRHPRGFGFFSPHLPQDFWLPQEPLGVGYKFFQFFGMELSVSMWKKLDTCSSTPGTHSSSHEFFRINRKRGFA